jgi:hypothetical protein
MDLSLNSLPCYSHSDGEENPIKRARTLLILYLYVHVFVSYEHELARHRKDPSKMPAQLHGISSHRPSIVSQAIIESEELLKVILSTGQAILEQLPVELTDALCVSR